MGEPRWMKQTNSKIRVGPEYQAVLPDLLVSRKNPQGENNTKLGITDEVISSPITSSSVVSKITTGSNQNNKLKASIQNSTSNTTRSEKALSQNSQSSTAESNSRTKGSTKTQKTISKTKNNNKVSSKSSK